MPHDLDSLLLIRTCVLALGQKDRAGWWACSFLTSAGERYLSTPFPRSAFWAALHASTTAAARHHDGRIGAAGTVHLFRLGPETELRLRDRVLREGWRIDQALLDDRDGLLRSLTAAAEVPETAPTEGPIRISDTKRFTGPKTMAQVAGHYVAAFSTGRQILPYASEK
jgi:hypothetical protein